SLRTVFISSLLRIRNPAVGQDMIDLPLTPGSTNDTRAQSRIHGGWYGDATSLAKADTVGGQVIVQGLWNDAEWPRGRLRAVGNDGESVSPSPQPRDLVDCSFLRCGGTGEILHFVQDDIFKVIAYPVEPCVAQTRGRTPRSVEHR
ncbi:MAG TPA: hypothetical protein VHV31_11345, partial [Nitrolancea sp.]|nr:hypothetical protein [Nitrolancea sp.]